MTLLCVQNHVVTIHVYSCSRFNSEIYACLNFNKISIHYLPHDMNVIPACCNAKYGVFNNLSQDFAVFFCSGLSYLVVTNAAIHRRVKKFPEMQIHTSTGCNMAALLDSVCL